MRRELLIVVVAMLLAPVPARAGLYDPEKPELSLGGDSGFEPLPFEMFRDRLDDVVKIGDPTRATRERTEALAKLDALAKLPEPTQEDLVRRAILRLRLRDVDAAIADLRNGNLRNNFFALTALGTAYQQTGQIAEAAPFLDVAADLFPDQWPAASREAARAVEAAQRKLTRLRLAERAKRPGGRPTPPEDVDALFDVTNLPANAVAVLQQLLLFLPDDGRLYWLLGEVYAARGDLDSASKIFEECINSRRLDAPLLRQHRQAVMEALAARQPAEQPLNPRNLILALVAAGGAFLVFGFLQFREYARRLARGRSA